MNNMTFFGLVVFAAAFIFACDDDLACDPQVYEDHCKDNVFYSCRQHSDERDYTDVYSVHSSTCPSTHPYCLTEPYGVGCSMTEDAGYCGQYAGGPVGYCVGDSYTSCQHGVVSDSTDCSSAPGLYCTSSGCDVFPDVREAVVGQACAEVCGDDGPQAFHIMGPFAGAPDKPFRVTLATGSGVLETTDGENVYFKNYVEPPEGLEDLASVKAQHCFCSHQS